MDHLEEIELEDLQTALDEVAGKKPTQRLIAAIAYKNGITQSELAEWYGVERKTIYNWLSRLESEPLSDAVRDSKRSGRRRKLSSEQRATAERHFQESPTVVGYEARTWTPDLVQQYLTETYDVAYSTPSCRRLMKEAGLAYRRPVDSDTSVGLAVEGEEGKRWLPRQ